MTRIPPHTCGDRLELIERVREFPIHGTAVSVREELYRCTVCGEEEYSYDQALAAERRASEVYRDQNGFLQPDEIAALRRRWGVTQAQLEAALGLGKKTVARWEAGRVLQTRALDNLLRAIDRFPAVLVFLSERQGIRLDADPGWVGEPGVKSHPGLVVPKSLLRQLEHDAREEGVSLEVHAVALLAQGIDRRSTNREIEKLNRRFNDMFEHVSQWETSSMRHENDDSWLRDYHEEQRNRASKAVAL